jgi:hypothetical protein
MKTNKKYLIISTIVLSIVIFGSVSIANFHLGSSSKDLSHADKLLQKVKDGNMIENGEVLRNEYILSYDTDDSTKQFYKGVAYQKENLRIDSNTVHFKFNNTKEFFTLNFKTQQAIYGDLAQMRSDASGKVKSNVSKMDSLQYVMQQHFQKAIIDSLYSDIVLIDNSKETENEIIIDVTFKDYSPITYYKLSYNKNTRLIDSSIIKYDEPIDYTFDDGDEEEDVTPEMEYLREANPVYCKIVYKCFNFSRGNYPVENVLKSYITKSKNKVALAKYKNYSFTTLKY